jgi:hypothetical protein
MKGTLFFMFNVRKASDKIVSPRNGDSTRMSLWNILEVTVSQKLLVISRELMLM